MNNEHGDEHDAADFHVADEHEDENSFSEHLDEDEDKNDENSCGEHLNEDKDENDENSFGEHLAAT